MDDGSDLAIISGSGKLPLLIKKLYKQAIYITFANSKKTTENKVVNCQFEKLGFLFDSLKENGIRRVVMAGSISRPQFDQNKSISSSNELTIDESSSKLITEKSNDAQPLEEFDITNSDTQNENI